MGNEVAVWSLIVAALAVFVGPALSMYATRKQIVASLITANKQITAPMRQAWINELRDLLAEFTNNTLHYYVSGYEDRTDQEYSALGLLQHKIILMLNPEEEDHKKLEELTNIVLRSLERGKEADSAFRNAHTELVPLSRSVLKREWNRVKEKLTT